MKRALVVGHLSARDSMKRALGRAAKFVSKSVTPRNQIKR